MQPRPAATPNPSIERTSSGTLRLPAAAAHVQTLGVTEEDIRMPTSLASEANAFLEEYNRAFASISGDQIAALYHEPCITVRGDGSVHCMQSRTELARFFQDVADTYYRDGYRNGRFSSLEVTPIGERSALITLDWEMLREDGDLIRQWRQSYNLVRVGAEWQILASIFHLKAP